MFWLGPWPNRPDEQLFDHFGHGFTFLRSGLERVSGHEEDAEVN